MNHAKNVNNNHKLFHDGNAIFNFTTSYHREHKELEDFQVNKQIMGVIGIMHCQSVTLKDGYARFSKHIHKYQNCLAHRCFAFEPKDTQQDDVKGPIMIPNVGNLSFYLNTMISDFCCELIGSMENLAVAIEKRNLINSPMIISPSNAQQQSHPVGIGTPNQPRSNISSPSTMLSLSSPSSAAFGPTPDGSNFTNLGGLLPSSDKNKKRTPSRAQKLIADIYLLAGRADIALSLYQSAIESIKASGDFLWHGAALEGYYSALLTVTLENSGIHPRAQSSSPDYSKSDEGAKDDQDGFKSSISTLEKIVRHSAGSTELAQFLAELPEKYREVISLYERSTTHNKSQQGFYPIHSITASLKMAKLCCVMWEAGFCGRFLLSGPGYPIIYNDKIGSVDSSSILGEGSERIKCAVGRVDVSTWIMKCWDSGIEYLSVADQMCVISTMASVFSRVGFKRKHAFFLRQAALILLGCLKDGHKGDGSGAMECMKVVCEVFGIGGGKDGIEEDDWLDDYADDADQESGKSERKVTHTLISRTRFGWPDLQANILREIVEIAEVTRDHSNIIIYTTRLLRRLHKHLAKTEQHLIYDKLLSVVAKTRIRTLGERSQSTDDDSNFIVKDISGGVIGVPVLRRISIVRQSLRKLPLKHSKKISAVVTSGDPFIYNPYAKNDALKTVKNESAPITLVANEPVYIDLVLANPFSFTLDIQSLTLRTNGVSFKPNPTQPASIPPETRNFEMRVSGIPTHDGTLEIIGCRLRMFGGSVQEDVESVDSGRRRHQCNRERIGKSALEFINGADQKSPGPNNPVGLGGMEVKVIRQQPVLSAEIGGGVGAFMLFEGERSNFPIVFENIGDVRVDYLSVAFFESYGVVTHHTVHVGRETQEMAYERDVYEHSTRAFWISGSEGEGYLGNAVNERITVDLGPGETVTVNIGVFGKLGCAGGTFKVEYGSLESGDADYFYTRQLFLPIVVSVQSALKISNSDILLYGKESHFGDGVEKCHPHPKFESRNLSLEEMMVDPFGFGKEEDGALMIKNIPIERANEYCLLTFDLKNVWNHLFEVSFEVYEGDEEDCIPQIFSTVVHAGFTKRVILPIKRILLGSLLAEATIPIPDWKQFVVGKTQKFSGQEEARRRSLFWYKEKLIGGLTGRGRVASRWSYSSERSGLLPLRSLHLSNGMFNALKTEEVSFSVSVSRLNADGAKSTSVCSDLGGSNFECTIGDLIEIEWIITNKRDVPIKLCFRIQPLQDRCNGEVDLNDCSGNKIMWMGSLQHLIPEIPSLESRSTRLPLVVMATGQFKLLYHAEVVGNSVQESFAGNDVFWNAEPVWLLSTAE